MRFLPGGRPIPRERLDGLVERSHDHWHRYGYGVWVLLKRSSGEIIGQCGLRYVDEVEETEVLYALARDYWGRGDWPPKGPGPRSSSGSTTLNWSGSSASPIATTWLRARSWSI
jgi:hypothetical protein